MGSGLRRGAESARGDFGSSADGVHPSLGAPARRCRPWLSAGSAPADGCTPSTALPNLPSCQAGGSLRSSAAAFGPCFTILITKITEKVSGKKLVKDNVVDLLAKISGWMIFTYTIAKLCYTARWANITAPGLGQTLADFYTGNDFYGYWILFAEIILGGVVPAIILISRPLRSRPAWRVTAFFLGCMGVSLNRWVMVLQVMAVPIMPFDQWALYIPSWQEVATTILPVAYGIILIMISYRYLPIFPQEAELNPIEEETAAPAAIEEADTDATPELEPAKA